MSLQEASWGGWIRFTARDVRPLIAALYQCGGCERVTLFHFQAYRLSGGHWTSSQIKAYPESTAIPLDDIPGEINRDRTEAWEDFLGGRNKSALIMARASLQRAVRTLSSFRGKLKEELDNLVAEGVISKQLRENAEEVRLTGNDAAHPEELGEVTKGDAEDSLVFLDDFLQTTLAVPARQRTRAERRSTSGP